MKIYRVSWRSVDDNKLLCFEWFRSKYTAELQIHYNQSSLSGSVELVEFDSLKQGIVALLNSYATIPDRPNSDSTRAKVAKLEAQFSIIEAHLAAEPPQGSGDSVSIGAFVGWNACLDALRAKLNVGDG